MAEKNYRGAPFGVQTARFDVSGVHPKSKVPGTFTQTPYCKKATSDVNTMLGPGKYEVEVGALAKTVAERASEPGWARAYEVSRTAAMPHLLHKEQWEMKRMLKRKLGPGSYEIKDFLQVGDEKPRSTRGIIHSRDSRFKDKVQSDCPGPGTYGHGGVPHAILEEKERKSASTVGLLDAGAVSRSLPTVGSHLGPGSYNFESFTEQTSKKVTSLRGPYDLYSGDRNKPIRTGHYAAPAHSNLAPGKYDIKSFLDNLDTVHKNRTGRFGKVDQYPEKPTERIYAFTLCQNPRKGSEPGPGQYDPKDPNVKPLSQEEKSMAGHANGNRKSPSSLSNAQKKSPGFLSSAQRNDKMATRFFTGNFNPVGPGRYDIQKWEEAQKRNGHSSQFKSKTGKLDAAREKFLQERIRAKDIPLQDRVFLVQPDHLPHTAPQRGPAHDFKRTLTVA